MNPGRLRAVFFDVGGTLLRPHPSVGAVYARVGERHGFIASGDDWENAFRKSWDAAKAVGGAGLSTAAKEGWRRLVDHTLDALELNEDKSARDAYFEELFAAFARADAWQLFPGALTTLEAIHQRGLHVGVISNWDARLRPLLRALQLDRQFDSITVSCEVQAEKPAAEIFRAALRTACADPEETMHVGDSYEEDVRGAEAVGMRAILIDRNGGRQRDCPVVPDLDGVLSAVI